MTFTRLCAKGNRHHHHEARLVCNFPVWFFILRYHSPVLEEDLPEARKINPYLSLLNPYLTGYLRLPYRSRDVQYNHSDI